MEEQLPHKLNLNERRQLTMTGVTEVHSFDENTVVLQTSLGLLIVQDPVSGRGPGGGGRPYHCP